MKVLIVSQYFWPENFRINDLSVELVKRGHEVTVLTGMPNYPDGEIFEDFRKAPASFANLHGVEIVRVPLLPRKKGSLRLMLNYLSFTLSGVIVGGWKLRGRKFDVVLTNQLSPVTVGLPAAWLARLKRAPMAMWVLDLWPDTLLALGTIRSSRILSLVGKLVSFIYRRCDLILAQSHSFVPQIRKLAGTKQRIEYFPSWAEDVFQAGVTVTPAPEVATKSGVFNVMFAGNIGECQDFPCILDAAQRLRDHEHIRWLIVGDGRVAPWVREELQRRGLEERVEMLGRHPLERMPSFFAHADALLVTLADQPIFGMTIPGKLQSYFAAGKPVVAALNGEGADLVNRTRAGMAAPAGNSQALAEAVLALSRLTQEQRDAMGAAGLAACRSEFDRHTIISRMESWLSGLAERSTDAVRAHRA